MNNYSLEAVSYDYMCINSCGRQLLYGSNCGSTRPHGRIDYHILYISEGCCFAEFDGKEICIKEGGLIFYPPHVPQKYRFDGEIRTISNFVHFSGTACEELLKSAGISDSNIFYVGRSTILDEKFSELADDFRLKLPFYEKAAVGMFLNILAIIGRRLSASQRNTDSIGRIAEVCRLMHSTYNQNLTVSTYAKACCLSESRFAHLFKEQMAMSPLEYLYIIKIDNAKEYLENTDLSINEISEKLGFQNQSYFCKFFT